MEGIQISNGELEKNSKLKKRGGRGGFYLALKCTMFDIVKQLKTTIDGFA